MISFLKSLIISVNLLNYSYWSIDNLNLTTYNDQFLTSDMALKKLIDNKQVQKINYLYSTIYLVYCYIPFYF